MINYNNKPNNNHKNDHINHNYNNKNNKNCQHWLGRSEEYFYLHFNIVVLLSCYYLPLEKDITVHRKKNQFMFFQK